MTSAPGTDEGKQEARVRLADFALPPLERVDGILQQPRALLVSPLALDGRLARGSHG